MTAPRSNVRVCANVYMRIPGVEASKDVDFMSALRTREAILALNPWVKTAVGIDWTLARQTLTAAQVEVLSDHFACSVCGRWDRWPVLGESGWQLSFTSFGCLCHPSRASEPE